MHRHLLHALLIVPLLLAGCTGTGTLFTPRETPPAAGDAGRDLLRAGRIDEAIATLRPAANSGDWRILTALGAAYDRKGDHVEALRWHGQADAAAPNNPTVLNNWALSLAQAGQRDAARALLHRAAALPGAPAQVQANLRLLDLTPGIILPPQ